MCLKPRGARGIEPGAFQTRGQLLSRPPTTNLMCGQPSVSRKGWEGCDVGLRGYRMQEIPQKSRPAADLRNTAAAIRDSVHREPL